MFCRFHIMNLDLARLIPTLFFFLEFLLYFSDLLSLLLLFWCLQLVVCILMFLNQCGELYNKDFSGWKMSQVQATKAESWKKETAMDGEVGNAIQSQSRLIFYTFDVDGDVIGKWETTSVHLRIYWKWETRINNFDIVNIVFLQFSTESVILTKTMELIRKR